MTCPHAALPVLSLFLIECPHYTGKQQWTTPNDSSFTAWQSVDDELTVSRLHAAVMDVGIFAVTGFEPAGSREEPFGGSLHAFALCAGAGLLEDHMNKVWGLMTLADNETAVHSQLSRPWDDYNNLRLAIMFAGGAG